MSAPVYEKRHWYHWVIIEATEAEMDALGDRIAEAVGCSDDPEHECPHFRIGGYRLPREEDNVDDERGAYIEQLERRIEALIASRPMDGIAITLSGCVARDGAAT